LDSPRIIRIRYRSGVNGRVATAYAKVEYSGLYDLNEKLARLLSQRQVRWFRVDVASPEEIERERSRLMRWHEALSGTVKITRVNLES
jgi:hypothetical protein